MNDQNPPDVADDDSVAAPQLVHSQAPEVGAGVRPHRRVAALGIAAAVIFTVGAGGGAAASLALSRSTTAATADSGSSLQQSGTASDPFGAFGGGPNGFGRSSGGFSDGFDGSGSASSAQTAATAEQVAGIVTIVSQLGYQDAESAGSGIVLTSSGRILTNNHVIDGATSITVTVPSTGASAAAEVVGTDATQDIAVLQLENAAGLTTADIATDEPSVGESITAVGNANGTGTLSAADGAVSALDQDITTSSEGGTAGESLAGLIEIDADVVSGDSGGAVKNSSGDVIGVTTAASSGTADITGYAIPIGRALGIARQIVAGDDTDEITIGLPAFLGVSIADSAGGSGGAPVGGVLEGTPAAATDLAAGDTITAIDGTAVDSGDALSRAIAVHQPGDRVQIDYTDATGTDRTVTVTLAEGPAD